MLKVKQVKQLKSTYVIYLNSGELFEFDVIFDKGKQEWALIGESRYYDANNRYSQAELIVILKTIKELNARDIKEVPIKKVSKKKVAIKKTRR